VNWVRAVITEADPDPITALLTRDWAAVGGWSLFIGVMITVFFAFMTERIVPGSRYKRQEELLTKTLDTLGETTNQNGQLITSNEITKHFFEETTPKRGTPRTTVGDVAAKPGGEQ
jgi:hypothetical protein